MRPFRFFLLGTLLSAAGVLASDGHAPRTLSFEAGIRQCVHESFSNLGPGLDRLSRTYATALFEFGWQVGGLTGRPAAYIGIPLQISWAPRSGDGDPSYALAYGWTVRHDLLGKGRRIVPFLGYGLLLNQFFVPSVSGHVLGHETRFDAGADIRLSGAARLLVKVEYSMSYFYAFGRTRVSAGTASFKTGLRF
jgi:hypothetical protein